jgi:hypothetical protein
MLLLPLLQLWASAVWRSDDATFAVGAVLWAADISTLAEDSTSAGDDYTYSPADMVGYATAEITPVAAAAAAV